MIPRQLSLFNALLNSKKSSCSAQTNLPPSKVIDFCARLLGVPIATFKKQLVKTHRAQSPKSRPSAPKRARVTREPHSDPKLKEIWKNLRAQYFPEREDLDNYHVCWSRRRQKRTLASCHIRKRLVHVAKELDYEAHTPWLEPLLYHEMCHAVLGDGIKRSFGKTPWHGSSFKQLEYRHPQTKALQNWIQQGGWRSAVRGARARVTFARFHKSKTSDTLK